MYKELSPDPVPTTLLSPALYLLPTTLSDAPVESVLPEHNLFILERLRHFVVENIREARRFIRKSLPHANIDDMTFFELNRHTNLSEASTFLAPLRNGIPMGLMSDAGCPGVADPGAVIVEIAQRERMKIVPLVGPSSILLGLMASGFNGQGFCFHGYLPIEENARSEMLRKMEYSSRREDMTHIFIETPYRNEKLMTAMVATLQPTTKICMASALTDPGKENVITMTSAEWKRKLQTTVFEKLPAIFLLYAGETGIADTHTGQKNAYRHTSKTTKSRSDRR